MIKKYPLSIAPMLDWTDRHFRYFFRLISGQTLLYSEMVSTNAILRGDRKHLLDFHKKENPLVLQLGGSEPKDLALCAKIGEDFGYDEINLNAGCPSVKVKEGNFGASLMKNPELVLECLSEMKAAVNIPVSIKTRIGVDDLSSYENLHHFTEIISKSNQDRTIVHARTALLNGLSPKENRSVPPIKYDYVYHLKKDFPALLIEINGEIKSIDDINNQLYYVDGVMIGREAYENPYSFKDVDALLFKQNHNAPSRYEIIEQMLEYSEFWYKKGIRPVNIFRHMLGLFKGVRGTKVWKQTISNNRNWENWSKTIRELYPKIPKESLYG